MAEFPFRVVAIAGLALVSGCVAYPYQTAFQTCDNAAGACYRGCEDFAGTPEYGQCHADCEYSADRCFDDAYEPYSYSYGYPTTWRGRYGYWYPDSGYAFSFGYYSGYRDTYYHRRRHRDYRDRHRDDWRDRSGGTSDQPIPGSGGKQASPPAPVRNTPPVGSGREGPKRVLPEDGGSSPRANRQQPPRVSPAPAPPTQQTNPQSSPSSPQASPPPRRTPPRRTQPRREPRPGEPDRDID